MEPDPTNNMSTIQFNMLTDVVAAYEDTPEKLSEWEQSFLAGDDQYKGLADKFTEFGESTRLSPKQWAIVERIHGKLNK